MAHSCSSRCPKKCVGLSWFQGMIVTVILRALGQGKEHSQHYVPPGGMVLKYWNSVKLWNSVKYTIRDIGIKSGYLLAFVYTYANLIPL